MNVDPVAAGLPALAGASAPAGSPGADALSGFGNWFGQQLSQVNDQLQRADAGLRQLALGDASNLHQVMINLEEARLSFQLLMQVRNRALEAYQEVMRMQV